MASPWRMAKLRDISAWLSTMLYGNDARVNSLILVGRKHGLFTTGGRGVGAPEMTAQDAATAVLLALYAGPPTKCHEAVRHLSALPWMQVRVAPDGPREPAMTLLAETADVPPGLTTEPVDVAEVPLPHQFDAIPETPTVALTKIFESDKPPYWLDGILVSNGPSGTTVEVTIYDLDKKSNAELCSERDFFEFTATYGNFGPSGHGGELGRRDDHSFTGEELRSLYDLIHGVAEDSE